MRAPALAVITAGLALASCGGGPTHRVRATPARPVASIPVSQLPSTLDGLRVEPENVTANLKDPGATYASAVGFFSLRDKRLVQATLEVIRLQASAPANNGFRVSLVNQISGGVPGEVTLSGIPVYQATGLGSGTSTWFEGRTMFILTVRSQFASPRSLLEAALGVHVR